MGTHGIPGGSPWEPRVGLWGPMGPWTRASGDPLARGPIGQGPRASGDPVPQGTWGLSHQPTQSLTHHLYSTDYFLSLKEN